MFIENLIDSKTFPHPAYRSCLGILRLSKRYGELRLNNACRKALLIGAKRYQQIEAILKNNLEEVMIKSAENTPLIILIFIFNIKDISL